MNELLMNFRNFFRNAHFSIFSHFDAWEPPYMAKPLQRGALVNTSMGPQAVRWTQPQPRKNRQFNQKSNSGSGALQRYIIRKDLRKRQKKGKTLKKAKNLIEKNS